MKRRIALTVTLLLLATAPTTASETATQACTAPEDPDFHQVVSVWDMRPRPSGVWVTATGGSDSGPILLGSNDDGATWIEHCVPGWTSGHSVFFLDDRLGWTTLNGNGARASVLRTVDGGLSWTGSAVPPGHVFTVLNDVTFVDAAHGWAVGEEAAADGNCCSPVLLRTVDGGATWTSLPDPPGAVMLSQVRFVDALHGWALDPDWKLARTEDGGLTWSVVDLTPTRRYRDMAFADRQTGWIIGNSDDTNSVWKTTDAGRTWTETARFPHGVQSLTVLDRDRLVVIGPYPATLEISDDGGRTWTAQPIPAAFTTLAAYDQRTLWGYGGREPSRNGCLYRSGDGGRTWSAHAYDDTVTCPPAA